MPETKQFYHFMRAEHALQAIERRRLKVSNLAETNDPYECLPFCFRNREEEKEFLRFQNVQEIEKKLYQVDQKDEEELSGTICFSEIFHDPLLWGHYAEKCKGICLGFDIDVYDDDDKDIVKRVKYVPNRLDREEFASLIHNYLISDRPNVDDNTEIGRKVSEQHKNLYFTKSERWKYEKEWRTWTSGQRDPVSGLYFADFDDRVILREILVGFRCTEKDIKSRLDKLVASYPDPPKIFSTRRSLSAFEIKKVLFQ